MDYLIRHLPVTAENELRLYLDGRDLYADLLGARRFVLLTGLHFMADFRLLRTGLPGDADSAIGAVLARLARRGVSVHLLVNQFWKDEQEVTWVNSPVRRKIMKEGELVGYLPQTYKLFQMLSGDPNIHCRTDIHPNSGIFGTHHQKTVVIDDEIAYLGGIDLTYLDGDRWDTPAHDTPPGRPPLRATDRTQKYWHDVHLRVAGPQSAVHLVRDNFVQRWRHGHLHVVRRRGPYLVGVRDDAPPALPDFSAAATRVYAYPTGQEDGSTPLVQIVRSMPSPVAVLPTETFDSRAYTRERVRDATYARQRPRWDRSKGTWDRSAKDAYLTGIRAARKYIYLENQWVADEHIWAELAEAAWRNIADPDFRIVLMVPYTGLFSAGLGSNQELWIDDEMERVIAQSAREETFGMYSLNPAREGQGGATGQVYVHSKVLVVDDVWALIGSANAGGISLEGVRTGRDRPDTELSAIVLDPVFAARFRQRAWAEHLGIPVRAAYDPRDADQFRVHAQIPGKRVAYFPGYRHLTGPAAPLSRPFCVGSTVVPTYLDRDGAGIPPTLARAGFLADVVPAVPAGTRLWYRWALEVPFARDAGGRETTRGKRYRLRSLPDDLDDTWEYSTHAAAYIGDATARTIDAGIRDVVHARVLCRVAFAPLADRSPPPGVDSMVLEYEVDLMNGAFAKANHPDFVR